mgnify:CR=1 FL=1
MKEKIILAIADMKSKIERDSKHIYRDLETGDMYQGVSTVSSIVPKDWLAAWGAKEAVKALGYSDYKGDTQVAKEMLAKIKSFESPEQLISLLKESKGAAFRKSKQAMIDGKAGHVWLEAFVQSKIEGTPIPIIPEGLLERPIKQFLEWEKENIDYWIASEAFVVFPEKRYAGQLDAIGVLKTGELCLIDFKFASNISEDYYLQTAGYAAPFEKYGITFDKRIIIRLPKTLEKEEWNEKEWKYYKIPNNIQVFTVPTKYEVDREAFFNALPLKQWINYVTKLGAT